MRNNLICVLLLCFASLLGWSQNYDEMIAGMNEQSLPLVNIEIDSANSEIFMPGRITISEYKNNAVETSSYICEARYRGNFALTLPKKSFNVKLLDEEGENLDANLLGLRTDNTWILDAMGIDKLRMRNRVCFDIWNEFNHTMWDTNYGKRNGTVGAMVEVFINGEYNGIYCLSDKINRQLLNLRKARVEDDGSVTVKGLLYKGIEWSALTTYNENASTNSVQWNAFELQHPDEYPSLQTWQPLINLIDFNVETDLEYFAAHYNEWYYEDNLLDYWAFLIAFGLTDMPYKNTFLSTPDINFGHRFMITPWDLDACLGRGWYGNQLTEFPEVSRLDNYAPYKRLKMYNIDGFKQKLAQRWQQLIENQLSPANLESHINTIAQRFEESGAWQREYERWKNSNIRIANNIDTEVQYVINWYIDNLAYANQNIEIWSDDYEPIITIAVVTEIYNYILGNNTTFYERLDLNKDGYINTADVTKAYNIIMGIESQ